MAQCRECLVIGVELCPHGHCPLCCDCGEVGEEEEVTMASEAHCRFCGCTEEQACVFFIAGERRYCWWIDAAHTVCSAPDCFRRWRAERRAA